MTYTPTFKTLVRALYLIKNNMLTAYDLQRLAEAQQAEDILNNCDIPF